jgi:glycerol-3-phosphate dehydrogenase (NAD(P)+)
MNISIIGGGSWGLAISKLLHDKDNNVKIWEFNEEHVKTIIETKQNPQFLPGINIDSEVTSNLNEALPANTEVIILATPSSFLQDILNRLNPILADLSHVKGIINVAKGYNHATGQVLTDMIKELLPTSYSDKICALSGPSHAEEVANNLPTTVTIAGENLEMLKEFQQLFSTSSFRAYITTDLIGVELGGAIKNVIALAAGIVAGLGLGDNTLGALLTRGNVEIKRLATALGAKSSTLDGLAGIGDLITTAISPHSRNRHVGQELGRGKTLDEILNSMAMVAEGVPATYTTYRLAKKMNVEMPIVESVYQVLQNECTPKEAIVRLMSRELKIEN